MDVNAAVPVRILFSQSVHTAKADRTLAAEHAIAPAKESLSLQIEEQDTEQPLQAPEETNREFRDQQEIEEAAEKINQRLAEVRTATSIQFNVDRESGEIIVRVVDKESGDVIRQIPPDDILAISRRLEELKGVLFNAQG